MLADICPAQIAFVKDFYRPSFAVAQHNSLLLLLHLQLDGDDGYSRDDGNSAGGSTHCDPLTVLIPICYVEISDFEWIKRQRMQEHD